MIRYKAQPCLEAVMTTSLKQAFTKASTLPETAQEQLAAQILEDVESELKWDPTLAGSQDLLEKLAAQALRAHQQGKTTSKGFDEL
jgi:hypothetical protein